MSKGNNSDKKLVLLVGILAAGIFSAAFAGTQLLSANAQSTNSTADTPENGTGVDDSPMPVDIGCPTGAEVCEDEIYGNSIVESSSHSVVSTSGTATTKVQPDKFSVTIGVETNGTTAQEAADRNADLMEEVIAALRALGIAEEDISTSSYNVYPVYEYRQPTEPCIMIYPPPPECMPKNEITGYRASNSVTVTLDVAGQIEAGEVIDAAIGAGANNVNGVFFFISQERQMEVQDGLIREAIDNARQRAEIAADAVGMEVTGVKSINLNEVYFPIFSRGFDSAVSEGAVAMTPTMPGQQEITSSVNVVYALGDSGGATIVEGEDNSSEGFGQREAAMTFLLERLPELGIQIDDEMDIHMDMITHISETEYHADFAVVDVNEQVHNGHIEVVNGEVAVAELDGESIL